MPRYNIRPRLQISFTYLPNVVRLALYGCEVDGVLLTEVMHGFAFRIVKRAAVEVAGGDLCGEVRLAAGQADGVGIV